MTNYLAEMKAVYGGRNPFRNFRLPTAEEKKAKAELRRADNIKIEAISRKAKI